MYTLYYLNRNLQLGVIKVDFLDMPISIPEDLVFCNMRKGINFVKEPHKCIDFTDFERLLMSSDFNDTSLIKDGDYRKQNTLLNPLCSIEGNYFGEYIVTYVEGTRNEQGKLHFNMPMPATGIYELEETNDDGENWYRVLYYTAHNEDLYMPEFPDTLISNKLIGSSDFPTCNNSMYFTYESGSSMKLRIRHNGVIVSQPKFWRGYYD